MADPEEEVKYNSSAPRGRQTRSRTTRRGKRTKYTKFYEDEESDSDVAIPEDFVQYFEVFKEFIDDFQKELGHEGEGRKGTKKRVEKAKSKEKEQNEASAKEIESKFANDDQPGLQQVEQDMQNVQEQTENTPQESHLGVNNAMTPGQQMNGQELLLQLLASQGNLAGLVQGASAQRGQGSNQNLGMENVAQTSAQSLLLLQQIIQNTPEIHVLHQQEQLALYQIQQHIRNALTQNLGQEIVSQLVLEYKKTQDHHQQNIQAAIQRKLTMILCRNNPGLFGGQVQEPPQPPPQEENSNIEVDIFKYNRSSYHLGISYYIYMMKKKQYDRERQQQCEMQQNVSQTPQNSISIQQNPHSASISTQNQPSHQAQPTPPQPAQVHQAPPEPTQIPSLPVHPSQLPTHQLQQHQHQQQNQQQHQPVQENTQSAVQNMFNYMQILAATNPALQHQIQMNQLQQFGMNNNAMQMPNGQFQQQQMQQNVATIRNKDEKDINSKVDDLMKS